MRLGVDVGGTFTDVVGVVEGRVVTARCQAASSSPKVLEGIERLGFDVADIETFAHGTTVATNALLERKGARTALITTEGFRDVVEIGRQNRLSSHASFGSRLPNAADPMESSNRWTRTARRGPCDNSRRPKRMPWPCACCSATFIRSTSER